MNDLRAKRTKYYIENVKANWLNDFLLLFEKKRITKNEIKLERISNQIEYLYKIIKAKNYTYFQLKWAKSFYFFTRFP